MLIEQLARALGARLVAAAFGFRAAEPRAIGGGVLLGALARRALLELLEINDLTHAGLRHAIPIVVATVQSIDESGKVRLAYKFEGEV
jgi:hypothetical protein